MVIKLLVSAYILVVFEVSMEEWFEEEVAVQQGCLVGVWGIRCRIHGLYR